MIGQFHAYCILLISASTVTICGCSRSQNDDVPEGLIHRAAIRLNPAVLDDFVGTYRLPSGALFRVIRDGDRLLGGTPPSELLPQTTRRFTSNRLSGEFHFDRSAAGRVTRMNYRLAKHDHWSERVEPSTPDPTLLVNAGGHRLRMLVTGEGNPTIVIEDGFGSGVELQTAFQARLSTLARVVSYDHASTGGSDPGPEPRNAQRVARELHQALTNAGLAPPYIMVGSSIGAEYIRIFAHEFPRDVVGLVLLDPAPEWDELLHWASKHSPERVHLYRRIYAETDRAMDELMRHQEPGRWAEWKSLNITRQQARNAYPLPAVPIVQITGAIDRQTSGIMHDKFHFFEAWLNEHIPTARHVCATHSGHAVEITDADLVIEELQRLIAEVKRRSSLM